MKIIQFLCVCILAFGLYKLGRHEMSTARPDPNKPQIIAREQLRQLPATCRFIAYDAQSYADPNGTIPYETFRYKTTLVVPASNGMVQAFISTNIGSAQKPEYQYRSIYFRQQDVTDDLAAAGWFPARKQELAVTGQLIPGESVSIQPAMISGTYPSFSLVPGNCDGSKQISFDQNGNLLH